jgi:putative peptide zinc metalloprotease protein
MASILAGGQQGHARLPPLRQDLGLYPVPPAEDGSPAWHLHDPAANRYYLLSWPAFEILSRWSLGDPVAILAAVNSETTLALEEDDVASAAQFLERHNLLLAASPQDSLRLAAMARAMKLHWVKWLLHNYLFFRIPLVRPGPFLDRFVGRIGFLLTPAFWWGMGALALITLGMVARQWDEFVHTFSAYEGLERILSFGVALSVAKICHELGHAFVARHHGCKVPTMGIAFLVMWPMLYTDTNEAWKLPSRRARFQIAIAGIATEMLMALLATLAWVFLQDGSARAAAFFLATTSWVLTLSINASPFMRFDGYFLLSDALGLPNLHSRAFAFGRWWLREKLFGLGEPVPEALPAKTRRFMIVFAFATWIYRGILFLSIAYLVYSAFFKALGIVLMLVEVGWFLILPAFSEAEAWWQRRHGMTWNRNTRRMAVILSLLFLWLLLPWQGEVSAPAILAPALEQSLYSPQPALVVDEPAREKQSVKKGDILLRLASPDLDEHLKEARIKEQNRRWRVEQQAFNEQLLAQGDALTRHWEEAQARVAGLMRQEDQLAIRAPFDGEIMARDTELAPGTWVTPQEMLYAVADRSQTRVDAYVGEEDLPRLHIGAEARFLPDAMEFGRRSCIIGDLDRVNVAELPEPALASVHGGPIPVHATQRGALLPAATLYRIRLIQCQPALAPELRLAGTAYLDADGRSRLLSWARQVLRVLIRESGF